MKPAEGFFGEIPALAVDLEMLEIAGQVIERKSARFEAGGFHDRALKELVEEKARGATISAAPAARESAR